MKKYLLVVVGFILGIIGTSYAAYKLRAEQISFDNSNTELNSDTVQDGIDELADLLKYGTASADDIKKGKTALIQGEKIIGTLGQSLVKTWKNFRNLELILEVEGLQQVTFDLEMPKLDSATYITKYPQVLMIDGSNDLISWTNLYTKKYTDTTVNAIYENEKCNFEGYKYLKFYSGGSTNSYINADYIYNMIWE